VLSRRAALAAPLLLALGLAVSAAPTPPAQAAPTTSGCPKKVATAAYRASVARAIRSARDLWGEQLLARRDGPTYAAASRYLTPLLYGQQRGRRPLTRSGVYYLPFALPLNVVGPAVFALHVADGSQVITRNVKGPSLTVRVGPYGRETYGACVARLTPAKLADGYLPILQTGYRDQSGVRYRQESFAGRVDGSPSIVSFIRLDVDATASARAAVVRLVPSQPRLNAADDRLLTAAGARLIVSAGGAYDGRAFRFTVPAGETGAVYALWLNRPAHASKLVADEETYEKIRSVVQRFWADRLDAAATFSVPEPRIVQAQRAMLVQQVAQTWRYSAGNPYEALSFVEALDTAEVMTGYGYPDVAKAILGFSLQRLPIRFKAWRTGEHLTALATYYRATHDRALLERQTPRLARLVRRIAHNQIRSGPKRGRLLPEQLSSDQPQPIDGVTAQITVLQGLKSMAPIWRSTGHRELSNYARTIQHRLERALRRAVGDAMVRLPDGSLFLPESFDRRGAPYANLSVSSEGSYWNLVVPYALASGFFPRGSAAADGMIRYLLLHGSRMLGVPRADAHIIYGKRADRTNIPGTGGLGQIYGLSVARLLADNDEPDQLVLSLYGQLAIGMTQDTYVSGEAVSVVPQGDAYYRKTYMPPNSGANSAFLETLRLMLVHERHGSDEVPRGLDLAFSTPRAWLGIGKTIEVRDALTSFGRLSFTVARTGSIVEASIEPPSPPPASLRLRLRLPAGERLASVRLGGRPVRFDRRSGTIDLSGRRGPIELVASVRRRGASE